MENNQQANSLIGFGNEYIYSEPIELNKKSLKSLKVGSWLEIEQNFLNVEIVRDNILYHKAKLTSDSQYFYLEIKKSVRKKFKKIKENGAFRIKFDLLREISSNKIALSVVPVSVTIVFNQKEYAIARLYISNNIFLEIKEILWKKFYLEWVVELILL